MSEFFESEIVKETMKELEEMQKKLLLNVLDIPYCSPKEKKEYIQLMRDFLEKQKVLLFRMTLSDDPDAQETKERIYESAKILGLKEGQSMNEFFEMMEKPIRDIEKSFGV